MTIEGSLSSQSSRADPLWWQKAVIYEVYPRSFQDSNGDGIGDLQGIIDRLDYFTWLGIDALWVTPIYPSPMTDFGYDVADYTDIHSLFGDLSIFDRLVSELHSRGIRLILDFVPNHTSDQHAWFKDAKSGRNAEKRNWYIWRDPAPDGGPPNNWVSIAGGNAWTLDEASGQYYCHFFLQEQPDLNWRNPDMCRAMYDAMRFWLKRGVDGFRLDVCWLLFKDERFRSDPCNPDYQEGQPDFRKVLPIFSADRPEIHEIMGEMRTIMEEFSGERLLIGEIYLPPEKLVAYYGERGRGLHLPFNFNLMWQSWTAAALLAYIETYEQALPEGGWPSWVLGNHDQMRIASRVGAAQARVAMLILLTLRGTPILYYGDELGLENVPIPKGQGQDPFGLVHPDQGRDPVRTPMPWQRLKVHAGFTEGEPWLPLGVDHHQRSVEVQRELSGSMLNLTRDLLILRRATPALSVGAWHRFDIDEDILAYTRQAGSERYLILANLDDMPKSTGDLQGTSGDIILSTSAAPDERDIGGGFQLRANEAVIIRCSAFRGA